MPLGAADLGARFMHLAAVLDAQTGRPRRRAAVSYAVRCSSVTLSARVGELDLDQRVRPSGDSA